MGLFSSSTAAKAAPGDAEKVVELVCACRERVHGIRSSRPRRLICKNCGTLLFLLPESPYPPPRPSVRSSGKSSTKSKSGEKSGSGKKKKTRRSRRQLTAAGIFGSILSLLLFPLVWTATRIQTATAHAVHWMIRPLHLAVILTTIILSTTGYFTYKKWQFNKATALLTTLPETCDKLLNEGNISEAAELMQKVSAAIDTTNRRDAEARRLQQLARELEATQNLSPGAIEEIVSRASDSRSQWGDIFASNYSGHWMILDTTAFQEGERKRAHVDIPFMVNEEPAHLVVDLPLDDLSEGEPPPSRAIFAARISACTSEGKLGWRIGLDSNSIVYLTDHRVYDSLRMTTGDEILDRETDQLLDQQAKRLEVLK